MVANHIQKSEIELTSQFWSSHLIYGTLIELLLLLLSDTAKGSKTVVEIEMSFGCAQSSWLGIRTVRVNGQIGESVTNYVFENDQNVV